MREVQTGVWHWEASHPDWKPEADWGPMVSSYAIDDGDRLLLFDPLAPPGEIDELGEDVDWCARENVLSVAPRLAGMNGCAAEIVA